MDDFEAREFSPTLPHLPSQHSGFRSNNASEYSERSATSSRRSYSPPAWRKAGSGWFKHQPDLSPHRSPAGFGGSRETSPLDLRVKEEEGDGDVTAFRRAMRVPLPASPVKGRSPSNSPEPEVGVKVEGGDKGGGDTTLVDEQIVRELETADDSTPVQSNCESIWRVVARHARHG